MARTLSNAAYRAIARLTSPGAAKVIDTEFGSLATTEDAAVEAFLEGLGLELTPTTVKTTNQTAAFGQLVVFNATSGALTCTAPNPVGAAGQAWGYKLETTASAHTVTGEPHASETFDGSATGLAPSTAGSVTVYTSDGTNWVLTGKI